jgi:hypothetical protein
MEKLQQHISKLRKENKTAVLSIGGDINLPEISWIIQTINNHQNSYSINTKFLDLIHDSLELVVRFPTRKEHVLDQFMTNIDANLYQE